VGIEEEFLLVDPSDGKPRATATAVLGAAEMPQSDDVEAELQLQQIETGTQPCRSLDQLEKRIRSASAAARSIGVEITALGTSPLPVDAELTPSPRYERLARRFGLTAQEQLTCGCHVHVGVGSDEEGVAVLDRIRPWLAPLLALSANLNRPGFGGGSLVESQATRLLRSPSSYRASNSVGGLPPQAP
jgi:carboxylate-amine ligase